MSIAFKPLCLLIAGDGLKSSAHALGGVAPCRAGVGEDLFFFSRRKSWRVLYVCNIYIFIFFWVCVIQGSARSFDGSA